MYYEKNKSQKKKLIKKRNNSLSYLDDLDPTKRIRTIIGQHGTVRAELARDAYVVFYELVKLCNHDTTASYNNSDIKGSQGVVFDETGVITPKDEKKLESYTLDTRAAPPITHITNHNTSNNMSSSSSSSSNTNTSKLLCKFV